MFVVVEIMLGMLMSVTGTFRTNAAGAEYAAEQNGKLKRGGDTYYQVWPLKSKGAQDAKTATGKKARSKRTSKA